MKVDWSLVDEKWMTNERAETRREGEWERETSLVASLSMRKTFDSIVQRKNANFILSIRTKSTSLAAVFLSPDQVLPSFASSFIVIIPLTIARHRLCETIVVLFEIWSFSNFDSSAWETIRPLSLPFAFAFHFFCSSRLSSIFSLKKSETNIFRRHSVDHLSSSPLLDQYYLLTNVGWTIPPPAKRNTEREREWVVATEI